VQNPVAFQWGIISSLFSSITLPSSSPLSSSLLPLKKWIKLQFYFKWYDFCEDMWRLLWFEHEVIHQYTNAWSWNIYFCVSRCKESWSQWPRGLRHEPSSPAPTLESWVLIPLEAWMSVCVYSVYIVLCVGSGLATGWSTVQGVLPTPYRLINWKSSQGPTKGLQSYR
jgi:hypothetical protein